MNTTDTPQTDALPSTQTMLTAQSDPVELYQRLCSVSVEYRKQLDESNAEVERLKSDKTHLITQCANLLEEAEKLQTFPEKLDTAIEIAKDAIWYARIYENEMHFDKIDMLYQKLVALKNDQ